MTVIAFIIVSVVLGLIGKFLVPGARDKVPLWLTILCGFGGYVVGWYAYAALGGGGAAGIDWVRWLITLAVTAGLVMLMSVTAGRWGVRREPARPEVGGKIVVAASTHAPAKPSVGHIFLSYRRDDTLALAGRIADHLEQRFPWVETFYDIDSIAPGTNFRHTIWNALGQSQVLLAVVDRHWAGWTASGRRRLDEPGDFVAFELRTAAQLGIPVIPVLDPYATPPSAASLPADLAWFADQQALFLHKDIGFDREMARLDEQLVTLLPPRPQPAPVPDPAGARHGNTPTHRRRVAGNIVGVLIIVILVLIILQLT